MHYVFGKKLDPPGPSPLRSPVSPSRPVSRFFQPPILHLIPPLPASSQFPLRPCLFLSLTTSFTLLHSPPPPRLLLFVDSVSPRRSFQLISLVLFPPPWRRMPRGQSTRVVYRIALFRRERTLCSSPRPCAQWRDKPVSCLYTY